MLLLVACAGVGPLAGSRDGDTPVDDVPGASGSPGGPPADDGGLLYGDEVLDLELDLDDAAIAQLAQSDDDAGDAPWVPAVFRHGDEALDVTVRLKGGGGSFRTFDEKPSFHVNFAGVDPDARFHGLSATILNNLVQDASMLGEHLAYFTYRSLGHAACRHGFARLTINGEWYGLYSTVEPVDHALLSEWWPSQAASTLLEGGAADLVPDEEADFDVDQAGDMRPLYDAVAALDAATPETYLATLDHWFDADVLLEVWAIEIATGNPDAYVTRHNNYFLYWHDRWEMLPWGTDRAFTEALDWGAGDFDGALYEKCLDAPDCAAALRERVAAVADWWRTGALAAEHDAAAARTEEACMSDPRSEAGPDGCAAARTQLETFIAGRPAQLDALVGG